MNIELRKKQQAEWIKQHTLTKEQMKILLENKFRRAEQMHYALVQRETLAERR